MTTKIRVSLFSLLAIGVVLVTTECPTLSVEKEGRQVTMKKLLPQKVEDYKADGKDEVYDRNTSFRYMDGAAELYRSYAFKLLMVRKYVKTNHPPILVDFSIWILQRKPLESSLTKQERKTSKSVRGLIMEVGYSVSGKENTLSMSLQKEKPPPPKRIS
jgi:hypothetical protein